MTYITYILIYLAIGLIWGVINIYLNFDQVQYPAQITMTLGLFIICWPILLCFWIVDKAKG